eukprot:TRINITY_DN8401_c0_g1_i3.p1 TRINITY_DN8401_c0_g1~~TRINITY_DN8401_c0_g1_i3.p1  ORF type:complete len:136 (+),score=21.63 TRINITY_DN8401_c0_g1_i3:76-483(+)
MSPVDFVSESIVKLSQNKLNRSSCYHFQNPHGSLSVGEVMDSVSKFVISISPHVPTFLPYSEWLLTCFLKLPPSNPLYPVLAMFPVDHYPSRDGTLCDCTNTVRTLSELNEEFERKLSLESFERSLSWLKHNVSS